MKFKVKATSRRYSFAAALSLISALILQRDKATGSASWTGLIQVVALGWWAYFAVEWAVHAAVLAVREEREKVWRLTHHDDAE